MSSLHISYSQLEQDMLEEGFNHIMGQEDRVLTLKKSICMGLDIDEYRDLVMDFYYAEREERIALLKTCSCALIVHEYVRILFSELMLPVRKTK